MPGVFDPSDDALAEAASARARLRGYQTSAQTAQLAGANRAAYNHLAPGDALALAQAGHGPDSDTTKQVAEARARHKVHKGWGWHSIGDIISGSAAVAKSGIRAGMTVVAAPLEEAQGVFRNITAINPAAGGAVGGAAAGAAVGSVIPILGTAAGAVAGGILGGALGGAAGKQVKGEAHWQPQSEALIAAGKLVSGKPVDLGSGFFPGGQVHEEQIHRAQNVAINGHALTPGRLLTAAVAEPGTKPYNTLSGLVDFAVAAKADPANLVGGEVGKARRAAKMFTPEDAGLLNGLRKTVAVDRVAEWLDSRTGQRVLQGLADDTSFDSVWRRTGKKLDVEDALAVSQLDDPAAVRAYLEPKLGVNIRQKPTLSGLPFENPIIRRVKDARIWQDVPGRFVNFDDPNQAVEQVDRFLRNANIRDPELIAQHTQAMAEAAVAGNAGDRYQAIKAVGDTVRDAVKESLARNGAVSGKATARARQLTDMWTNRIADLVRFNVDDIGENAWFPGVKVNGADQRAASPHLLVEGLNSRVPLPDFRDIRTATSRFGPLLDNPAIKIPRLALEHVSNVIWKPLVLIRGAWPVRVVGEEQIRMAAAGFDSFANHPISALATVVGDDGRVGKLLKKVGINTARGETDVFGETFRDAARLAPNPTEFEDALYKGRVADPVGRARTVVTRHKVLYDQMAPEYAKSWAEELMQLRADPIGERVALGGLKAGDKTPNALPGIDGIKDWFWHGTGRKLREDLIAQGVDATSRANADAYIDTVVKRLHVKTAGNTDLVQAVATGDLNGVALRAGEKINPKFIDDLEAIKDTGPTMVKGDLGVTVPGGQSEFGRRAEHAVNWMFEQLMVKPSNKLSRSPTFRQAYWNRMEELIPFMDDATQKAAIKAAGEAGLDRPQLRSMARKALAGKGTLDHLDQADLVAKGHALETTRDLLYDIADKGQFADQMRLIFPFAEAWKEVVTRWAKLIADNPTIPRRAEQLVLGARGAGFFHPDPTSGEEVFTYPGSAFMSEHLLGVRVPFTGRVQGLSLAANVIPGFGPAVQIPASKIIPNTPDWDWLREAVIPFGEQQTEGGFAESFLPAWMQKARTALFHADPEHNRQYANTVMDVARYLLTTGDEYSTNSPEDVQKLLADSMTKAKRLYALRSFAQFWAPSAPTPEFLAKDKDGKYLVAQKLIEDFRTMQNDDYDTAVQRFLDTYGQGALLFMQPKTQGGPPSTTELDDWVRDHPEQVKNHRDVYAFFGPTGGDFSIELYNRQIRSGERQPLTPEEAVKNANQRVASMIYRQAKDRTGGDTSPETRQWLGSIKEALVDAYPGYDPLAFDDSRIPRLVRSIERAVDDPVMGSTGAGQAIKVYLQARDKATEAAKNMGLSTYATAKRAEGIRDWLRGIGESLVSSTPDFSSAWEQVFSREMLDDVPEGQAA